MLSRARPSGYSIVYLSLLFAALLVDHYVRTVIGVMRCFSSRDALSGWDSLLARACCSQDATANPAFTNLDITGNTQFGSDFSLPDTSGKIRTLGDFKGKAVVLFFGYTHCPDVCPTTLAELSQALQKLGEDAKRVQVLMVTVDPARDTAAVAG